jgi:hypothetical protein
MAFGTIVRISQLVSVFKEASKNFILNFLFNYGREAENLKKTFAHVQKVRFNCTSLPKKYSTGDIILLHEKCQQSERRK